MAPFPLIPLLLLFAVPITSYPIENICQKTNNPQFCLNNFGSYSNLNLPDIALKIIEATYSSAARANSESQILLSSSSDPNLKTACFLCLNYYSAAASALDAAKEKVKSGQFGDLNGAANTVSRDVVSCKQALGSAPKPAPGLVEIDNDDVDRFNNVFIAVSGVLSSGSV